MYRTFVLVQVADHGQFFDDLGAADVGLVRGGELRGLVPLRAGHSAGSG